MSVREFLASVSVETLCQAIPQMVFVEANDHIPKVFQTLVTHNVLCVPVYDRSQAKFIGLIDMVDIVTFVVSIVKDTEALGTDYFAFLEREELFRVRDAKDITDLSRRNGFFPITKQSSLLEAMQVMSNHRIHRVPVMDLSQPDEASKLVNIVTQSAIINFLAHNLPQLGLNVDRTLADLGFAPKEVVSVTTDAKAIDAFKLMAEKRVSGVAVLDNDGRLMTNISVRDLRSITRSSRLFQKLFVSVGDFVSEARQADLHTTFPSICCSFDEHLNRVIGKLAAARIHRIWVVNDHRSKLPVGIISLTDVIEVIVRFP